MCSPAVHVTPYRKVMVLMTGGQLSNLATSLSCIVRRDGSSCSRAHRFDQLREVTRHSSGGLMSQAEGSRYALLFASTCFQPNHSDLMSNSLLLSCAIPAPFGCQTQSFAELWRPQSCLSFVSLEVALLHSLIKIEAEVMPSMHTDSLTCSGWLVCLVDG